MDKRTKKRVLATIFGSVFALSGVLLVNQSTLAIVQGSGLGVYGEGTVQTPRTREYRNQDTTWNTEASLPTVGATVSASVIKTSPTRNEAIAGVVNTSGLLTIFRWDGTTETWSSEWSVTTGHTNLPRFDIAYEQSSGDAVVFYSRNVGTTNELATRRYDSEEWTPEASYDAVRTSGTILYVQAKTRPGTDEIGVVWLDSSLDASGNYWNGTTNAFVGEPAAAFSTGVSVVGVVTVPTTRSIDLAFEETSGELLVCWGNGTTLDLICKPRTAGTGGAWGTTATHTALTEEPTDLQMASEPGTNYIAYANISDNGADADAAMWTGTAWGNVSNFDTAIGTVAAATTNIAVEWVQSGGQSRAVVTYEDSLSAGIDWWVFNKNAGTWAAQTDYTTAPAVASGNDREHRIYRNPFNTAELMIIVIDTNSDLFAKRLTFNGTTFAWAATEPGAAALEATLASATGWAADFAFNSYAPAGTLTSDIIDAGGNSVASPSVALSTITSNFTCQASTGTLGEASQKIRIANTTVNDLWTLSIAPTGGATANWSSGLATYDFNDGSGAPAGCADGAGDADGLGGRLSVNPSAATITPRSVCSNTGVSLGSSSAFDQGTIDNITIASSSASATYDCYWDITGITVSQQIPHTLGDGSYSLPMTLTIVAN